MGRELEASSSANGGGNEMWGRRNSARESELEAALRRHRPVPSSDFVHDLSSRLVPERLSSPRAWSRLAFASAVSVFILGTFASFGGLSYAASGATGTYDAVKQVVVQHKLTISIPTSSATAQYPNNPLKPPTVVAPVKKTHKHAVAGSAAVQGGTLPFTGLSLLGTLVLSLALIGAGLALRRRERRN
jgi:hypothetical protein